MPNSILFKSADFDDETVYFRDADNADARVRFGVSSAVTGDITLYLPNANNATLATTASSGLQNPLQEDIQTNTYSLTLDDGENTAIRNSSDNLHVKIWHDISTPANERIELLNTTGTATDALKFNAIAGGVDIDGTAGFTIDGGAASTIATSVGNLGLTAASELDLTGGGTVGINAGGVTGITLDAASGPVSLQGNAASDFTVVGADLTLQTTTSGDVNVTPVGNVELASSGATSHVRIFQKYYHQIDGATTLVAGTNTNRASITPATDESDFVVTATSVSRYTTDGTSSYFMESKRSFQQDSLGDLIPIHDTFVMTGGISGGTRALTLAADGTSITVDLTGDSGNDCTWIGMIEVITNDGSYTYSAFS